MWLLSLASINNTTLNVTTQLACLPTPPMPASDPGAKFWAMWGRCWVDLGSFGGYVGLVLGHFGGYDGVMLGRLGAARGFVRFVLGQRFRTFHPRWLSFPPSQEVVVVVVLVVFVFVAIGTHTHTETCSF